jgi:hypothetical protein
MINIAPLPNGGRNVLQINADVFRDGNIIAPIVLFELIYSPPMYPNNGVFRGCRTHSRNPYDYIPLSEGDKGLFAVTTIPTSLNKDGRGKLPAPQHKLG